MQCDTDKSATDVVRAAAERDAMIVHLVRGIYANATLPSRVMDPHIWRLHCAASALEHHFGSALEEAGTEDALAQGLSTAALADVNWHEIAKGLLGDHGDA